jgi:enoyl-CoA hydratase/carnithine racemase
MNRPAKKNALTLAMYDAMAAAVEESGTNGAIRCLLIAGRAWIILRRK